MIEINNYPILAKNVTTLKETSLDDTGKKYMTYSQITVVNFDDVKKNYIANLGLTEMPESNDALYIGVDGKNEKIIFIEFKNGTIRGRKETGALGKKIYDSVLILSDIIGMSISKMRQEVDYILVVNENAKSFDIDEIKKNIPFNPEFDKTIGYFSELGGKKFIPFNLERFKGYCFKDIDVFTQANFERYLHNL